MPGLHLEADEAAPPSRREPAAFPARSEAELQAVYEIGKVLSLTADVSRALTSTLTFLRLFVGLENGSITLFDPVTGELSIEAAPEMPDEERIRRRSRPGEGLVGRIFQAGMPVVVPDLSELPGGLDLAAAPGPEPRALVGVPIRHGRATYGVLAAFRPLGDGPPALDRDTRLLSIVAGMVAARVRLSRVDSPAEATRDDALPSTLPSSDRFPAVVAESALMREALALVSRVAQSRATVLVRGESGTGKEVVARAIHDASPRAGRPFVAVNCAALSDSLVESELFGHERGAFTGAVATRPGRFELADGGTLFLDEVGEIPLATQVKLLRVLQERQFERVGGQKTVAVDVRIVAATNRNLEEAIQRGEFRLDLYHRLSVVTVRLPPLRDRPSDLPVLVRRFLADLGQEYGRRVELTTEALACLQGCRWSGNVRQLRNCLERAVVSAAGDRLGPGEICPRPGGCELERVAPAGDGIALPAAPPVPALPPADEQERVRAALERTGHVQAKAARLLGMTERQLAYRVRKYGIPLRRF